MYFPNQLLAMSDGVLNNQYFANDQTVLVISHERFIYINSKWAELSDMSHISVHQSGFDSKSDDLLGCLLMSPPLPIKYDQTKPIQFLK